MSGRTNMCQAAPTHRWGRKSHPRTRGRVITTGRSIRPDSEETPQCFHSAEFSDKNRPQGRDVRSFSEFFGSFGVHLVSRMRSRTLPTRTLKW